MTNSPVRNLFWFPFRARIAGDEEFNHKDRANLNDMNVNEFTKDYWNRRSSSSATFNDIGLISKNALHNAPASALVESLCNNVNSPYEKRRIDSAPNSTYCGLNKSDDLEDDRDNVKELPELKKKSCLSKGRKLSVAIRERDDRIAKEGIRKIYFSFHFMKFGDIETKRQQFNAEILIRARWYEPELKSVIDSGEELFRGILWDPQLYIVNLESVQSNIDHVWYDIKVDLEEEPYVTYNRRVRGNFFEKMELWEFPRDIQDLNVTISSELGTDKVELIEDTESRSYLDREMFQDEQNWYLYDHIEITQTIPDPKRDIKFSIPIISATCRVARNPRFYLWNNYFIMSCLAFLALTAFSIEPKDIKYRIATLLTLLLTSVAFKLSTTGQLPMISYHTLLDLYILQCMIFLIAVTCHVSVISIWKDDPDLSRTIDFVSMSVVSFVLVASHVIYIIGFFAITSKRRRIMSRKEKASKQRQQILKALQEPTNTRPTIFTAQINHNGTLIIQEPMEERAQNIRKKSTSRYAGITVE